MRAQVCALRAAAEYSRERYQTTKEKFEEFNDIINEHYARKGHIEESLRELAKVYDQLADAFLKLDIYRRHLLEMRTFLQKVEPPIIVVLSKISRVREGMPDTNEERAIDNLSQAFREFREIWESIDTYLIILRIERELEYID